MNAVLSPPRPARREKMLFTVEQYEEMAEKGVFHPEDRIELIEGEIIRMTPIGSPHAACVDRLDRLFQQISHEQFRVRTQCPIKLAPRNEPQPDIAIVRPREDIYESEHPTAGDILLLIEVSDTTIDFDRDVKIPMYARRGVVEAWLVDLAARCVEVYCEPGPSGYKLMRRAEEGESVTPGRLESVSIPVASMFGKRGK